MEQQQNGLMKSKGGRPKKPVKKDYLLAMKCSMAEKMMIQGKAKKAGRTVSEYLREIALSGKIDMKQRALPKEVLLLTATINHIAANLNQIAKRRNGHDELTPLQRTELMVLSKTLQEQTTQIKAYLK